MENMSPLSKESFPKSKKDRLREGPEVDNDVTSHAYDVPDCNVVRYDVPICPCTSVIVENMLIKNNPRTMVDTMLNFKDFILFSPIILELSRLPSKH